MQSFVYQVYFLTSLILFKVLLTLKNSYLCNSRWLTFLVVCPAPPLCIRQAWRPRRGCTRWPAAWVWRSRSAAEYRTFIDASVLHWGKIKTRRRLSIYLYTYPPPVMYKEYWRDISYCLVFPQWQWKNVRQHWPFYGPRHMHNTVNDDIWKYVSNVFFHIDSLLSLKLLCLMTKVVRKWIQSSRS